MTDPESSLTTHRNVQPKLLTELPMGLPGRIFRCSMPYSPYDPNGQVLQEIRHQDISVIVLLAEADECLTMTGRDLPGLNRREGFQVLHLPIPDGGVPLRDQLEQAVTSVIQHAQAGQHLAIHYYAGTAECIRSSRTKRTFFHTAFHVEHACDSHVSAG